MVNLYLNPPEQATVLCVDEKSQIQPLDRLADEKGALGDDARLQAPRDDPTVGGSGTSARQSRGGMLATAPPSAVPEFSPPPRERVSQQDFLTPGDEQLSYAHKGGGAGLAAPAPSLRASFCAHQQFAELGGPLV